MNAWTDVFKAIWEVIVGFFKSDIPERILLWLGGCTEGLVNLIRNIIDMFVN